MGEDQEGAGDSRGMCVEQLIRITLRHRRLVVGVFLAVMAVCACFIPFVRTNYDMVDYLPDDAQSTTAVRIMSEEFETAMPNANVMVRDITIPQALEIEQAMLAMDGIEDVIWLDKSHFEDDEAILREMLRILREKGII